LLFQVKVTRRASDKEEEKFIRYLEQGDFFGEKALRGYYLSAQALLIVKNLNCFSSGTYREENRTANIVADFKDGVTCLVLDRE
jgi:cGMP-dependent protein kinase 1